MTLYQDLEQVKNICDSADLCAEKIARILVGRLRNVTSRDLYSQHNILRALKRELSEYNASKREWKS